MEVADLPPPPRRIQLAEDDSIEEPPAYPEVNLATPAPLNQQGPVKFEKDKYALIGLVFFTVFNFIMKIVMVVTFATINVNSERIESRTNLWVVLPSLLMIPNLWQYFFIKLEPFFSRNSLQECEVIGYLCLFLDIILIAAYPFFCFQNPNNAIAVFNAFIAALVGIMLIASDLLCLKLLQKYDFFDYYPYDATSKLVLSHRIHTTYLSDKAIITESGPFRIAIKNIAEDGTILKGRFQVRRAVDHLHTDKAGIIRRKYEVCEVKMNIEIPPNGSLFLIPSNHTLDSSEEIITFSEVRCFGREKGFEITTLLNEIDERLDNLGIPAPIGTYAILKEFYIVDQ